MSVRFQAGFATDVLANLHPTAPPLTGSVLRGGSQEGAMPVVMKDRLKFPDRKIEPLNVRRDRQSIEGAQAMKDYKHTRQAARERMAALRAERLAREKKDGG
jgi:hypothetical protein